MLNIKRRNYWFIIFVAIFFFNSIAYADSILEVAQKKYGKYLDKDFVLIEKDESLQKYGYMFYRKEKTISSIDDFSYVSIFLPCKEYVNKKGKITNIVRTKMGKIYLEVQLETGEKYYFRDDEFDNRPFYFIEEYEEALKMMDSFIWIKQNAGIWELITEDKNISYQIENLEKVKIIGILTKKLGHSSVKTKGPFFLKVQKQTGEIGLIKYNKNYYFNSDPINPKWGEKIIKAIKNRDVLIGMTPTQVLLSWGNPKKINKTITKSGILEQWVYGDLGPYLYFENDKLVTIQKQE